MKNTILILTTIFVASYAAQSQNTFPTSGNVGIGTSSPGYLLDIKGSTNNQNLFRLSHPTSPTAAGLIIGFGKNPNALDNLAVDFKVEYSSVDYNVFSINRENRDFYYNGDGNVGIGTTAPGSLLNVGTKTTNSPSSIAQFGAYVPNGEARVLSLVNSGGGSDQSTSIDFHNNSVWSPTGKIQVEQRSTYTQSKIHFFTYNSGLKNRMTIDHNGSVGIGTTNPSSILHINSASILPSSSAGMAHSSLMVSGRDGNLDLLSFDDNTTVSNNISFGRYHESTGALIHKFGITSWANTGNTGSNSGDKISFSYGTNKDIWNNSNLMVIEAGGNVGIGTTTPQSKLAVNGHIRATGVKVLADVNSVPDYVFEEDYELTTLKETKAYISENKHLPEIPSAVEIGENGIDLGEMNMRLLKKIEELTLHMIRIDEELQEMKVENKELRNKISGK